MDEPSTLLPTGEMDEDDELNAGEDNDEALFDLIALVEFDVAAAACVVVFDEFDVVDVDELDCALDDDDDDAEAADDADADDVAFGADGSITLSCPILSASKYVIDRKYVSTIV